MQKSKFAVVFLAVLLMFSFSMVYATQYEEVGTPGALTMYLEKDGDVDIKVIRDIVLTTTVATTGEYWTTIGSGTKTLDLNGFSVELNAETGYKTTMIKVPEGAELVINDSSGNNSGKLFCYGRIDHPGYYGTNYSNGDVKFRDLIYVD